MDIYEVYDKCYTLKNAKLETNCFHWVKENKFSDAELYSGSEIKKIKYNKGPDIKHFENCKEMNGCGNPWNFFNNAIMKNIIDEKPKKEKTLLFNNRPNITVNPHNYESILKEMEYWIYADCWMVYKRNKFGETTKMYSITGKGDKRKSLSFPEIIKNLKDDETLVLVMNIQFKEIFICKVGDMFSLTIYEYPASCKYEEELNIVQEEINEKLRKEEEENLNNEEY